MKSASPTTQEQYDAFLEELTQDAVASRAPQHTVRMGLDSCFAIFSDFEFAPDFSRLIVRRHKLQTSLHIARELAPALTYAHQYFGSTLPQDLIDKLRNKTQILDTLFELRCLGLFQLCHKVIYEPKLCGGKVPDLKVSLNSSVDIYIECKSQHILDSEYQRIFEKFTSQCFAVVENSKAQKAAWEQDLRIEIHLKNTPQSDEIDLLRETVKAATVTDLVKGIIVGKNINVLAVHRNQRYLAEPSANRGHFTVGTVATEISDENADIVTYSWPGIDLHRRRSQRRLLCKARSKLRDMPLSSYGMACLQILGAKRFAPDVHAALSRPEYERVPLVWINPLNESELICRNDALAVRDALLLPLQEMLGVASDSMDSNKQ